MANSVDLPWQLYVELRKEMLEAQKLREQMLALKVTAVGAGIAVILANTDRARLETIAIPALAAVMFDIRIGSLSVGIRNLGAYLEQFVEPQLKSNPTWDANMPMWEEHVRNVEHNQLFVLFGSSGFTLFVGTLAIATLIVSSTWPIALAGSILLFAANAYGTWALSQRWQVAPSNAT